MLTEFCSGNDNLSVRNIVVCEVNNFEKITNVTVVIDLFGLKEVISIVELKQKNLKYFAYLFSNGVDELDNSFSADIARCSFTSEHNGSGLEFSCSVFDGCSLDFQITMDDVENVHELSLVFVDTLDLL